MDEVNEINTLIDIAMAPSDSSKISQDHIAFEMFDHAVNLDGFEYTKYEDERDKGIYGTLSR